MENQTRSRWNPWPISIIVFFIIAIIGCGSFVAFCSRHPADLVASDYYEQEVHYQGQIDRLQHAQQRAQLASVEFDSAAQAIKISLPPHQSYAAAVGSIQFYRPSALNLDRKFELAPGANGVQMIDAATLSPGLWKVRVSWTVDNQDYFLDQKVIVRAKT